MGASPVAAALTILGLLLLAVHLVRIVPSRAQACLARLRGLLRACLRRTKEPVDGLEEVVQARVLQWQIEQFQSAAAFLALLYLYAAGVLSFEGLFSLDVNPLQIGIPSVEREPARVAFLLLGYGTTLLLLLSPGLSGRTVDAWFWLLAAPILLLRCPLFFYGPASHSLLGRAFLALMILGRVEGKHTAAFALAWLLATLVAWPLGAVEALDQRELRIDVVVCGLNLLFCWLLRLRCRAQVRAEVELEFLQQRQQAFRALLKTFYDVVLELDCDLRITGGGAELAALLLLQGPGARLEGRAFPSFMREEERPPLLLRLQLRECSMAEAMHVRLRGADGALLEAELFCFSFRCPLKNVLCHVVGLREYGEETHGVPRQLEDACEEPPQPPGAAGEEGLAATVDLLDPRLPIVEASPRLKALLSQGAAGLAEQLLEAQAFSAWLHGTVSLVLSGHSAETSWPVRFRARGVVQMEAICSLCLEEGEETNGEVRLVFNQVQRRLCKGPASTSLSSPESSAALAGCYFDSGALPVVGL